MLDPKLFFDELNVLQDEKDRRYDLAMNMKKELEQFFLLQLAEVLAGMFLVSVTSAEYREELFDLYILMILKADKDLVTDKEVAAKARRFADYIEDTTEKIYQNAIGNDRFELSRQMNVAMLEEDVPDVVSKALSPERALEISCNESNWIYNYIQHDNLVQSGQVTHTWLSQEDERVRPTHAEADGQTVPINTPFTVGGYLLMFPCDDSLGAPAKEVVLCRCVEV